MGDNIVLTIQNFRCYDNHTISFPIGKTTLLKGKSGSGKTTILMAISWVLYGHIRKIESNNSKNKKPCVKIIIPYNDRNLVITRTKNPCRLILDGYIEATLEDDPAQAVINQLYGSKELWMATSYVGQKQMNSFIQTSNDNKIALLNSIAFHQDDPAKYIEIIGKKLYEFETQYKMKNEVYTRKLKEFTNEFGNININEEVNISELNEKLSLSKLDKEKLILQSGKYQSQTQNLNNLRSRLSVYEEKRKNIEVPESLSLQDILDKITSLYIIKSELEIINKKKQEIADLKRYYNPNLIRYSHEDLANSIRQDQAYSDSKKILSSFKINYDITSLNNYIKYIRERIDSQTRLSVEVQLKNKSERIAQINNEYKIANNLDIPEYVEVIINAPVLAVSTELESELNKLFSEKGKEEVNLSQLIKGKEVIPCPHCENSLIVKNGVIIKADHKHTSEDEINESRQKLNEINKKLKDIQQQISSIAANNKALQSKYYDEVQKENRRKENHMKNATNIQIENSRREQIRKQLFEENNKLIIEVNEINEKLNSLPNSTNTEILSANDLEYHKSLLLKLKDLKILEPPTVTQAEIRENQKLCEFHEKYMKLSEEFVAKEFSYDSVTIKTEICKYELLKTKILELNNINEKILDINKQISDTKLIENPEKEQLFITNCINDLEKQIKNAEIIRSGKKRYQELVNLNNELNVSNNRLQGLHMLHNVAKAKESEILEQVVDSINSAIENVCNSMFDDEISIIMNLFKINKVNKNIKPSVNFKINYKGGEYDSIEDLSGGESDRASIAFTVAFSRLSPSPLLILDETLGSLDADTKENVIQCLEENTDKTILLVMHDGCEGLFHHVVESE